MKSFLKKHFAMLLYLALYAGIFAQKLIRNPQPFFDWDESIYAEVGREMINRTTLVPLWQYDIWLDKPPLVPLVYGSIIKLTPLVQPEISTRLFTLGIAVIALYFVYLLYYKATKDTLFATAVVVLTSCTSIILQRALVLNIDIFLLIGWLGYIVFYEKRKVALGFLAIAVLSKSIIGFYAPGIMALFMLYQYLTKKISKKEFVSEIRVITIHIGILSIWYILMFAFFGRDFFIQHIYESHTKRVTASIESHFGQRTFYITLLTEYFGNFAWISIIGFIVIFAQYFKKKISNTSLLMSLFLLPWFIFLNGTKTKIFWYSHPYIPQFAFLILYPLTLLKLLNKKIYIFTMIVVILGMIWTYFGKYKIADVAYATREPHHTMAEYAKDRCHSLVMLMNSTEREKIATLKSMDLTITTTTWWGEHPSMVYYFEKPIDFIYTIEAFEQELKKSTNNCIGLSETDTAILKKHPEWEKMGKFGTVYLYKTPVK